MTRITADTINFDSVRYTQEKFYPRFSNGKMSVSETYVALINDLLDPASFSPISVFEHGTNLYCIDTRRLKMVKELQRRNQVDVLKRFPVQYADKNHMHLTEQYKNLVEDRLPAMRRQGLNGQTIRLVYTPEDACCFDQTGDFRSDLERHIAERHLNMSLEDFKNLNVLKCSQCGGKAHIIAKKRETKSFYEFFRKCACSQSEGVVLGKMEKPWTEVTFSELCDEILKFKKTLDRSSTSLTAAEQSPVITKRFVDPRDHFETTSNTTHHYMRNQERNNFPTLWFIVIMVIIILVVITCIFLLKKHIRL